MTERAAFVSGLLAAVLAALPAAFRFESSLAVQAYFVCLAGCALLMAPLSAALAGARASQFRTALTLGVLVSALPLLPFATLLKATTRHRPLGGVTFAVVGGLLIIALSLICARFVTWAGVQPGPRATVARVVLGAFAAVGTSAVLLGAVRGLEGGSAYQTGIYDALRVLALTTLAARVPLPETLLRRVRGLGLAAWIAVVTVGVCLGRAPAMQAELAARCPVLQWPLVWLGG
ncbi:MAG TPA: hypothetical protein VFK05_08480 [Polyangiaceae bacterium]|nr:hypothetical protein [Polyangiaceae bacterium]